jgi:hypothetical protein
LRRAPKAVAPAGHTSTALPRPGSCQRRNLFSAQSAWRLTPFATHDSQGCRLGNPRRVTLLGIWYQSHNYAKVQSIIENWATGLLDRRGESQKFLNEFQTTFNSSMWELYLNRALMDLGCSVDFSKSASDFFVRGPGNYAFNIEAVVSGQPPAAKQQKTFDEQDFKTRGALKLAGTIRDKLDLYRESNGKKHPYSSMGHVCGRPFIIAIAPFDSDLSLTQNNELINMVLFGLAPPVLEGPNLGKQDKVTSLLKPSGARVEMGIFTNDSFKEISAVFFSTVGTFGKAVVESKIERLVRSTRYRVIDKDRIPPGSKLWQLGTHGFQFAALNYLLTQRRESAHQIGGADVHIQHSSFHRETHLDGLQVISIRMQKCRLTRNSHGPQKSRAIITTSKAVSTSRRILTVRSFQGRFMK